MKWGRTAEELYNFLNDVAHMKGDLYFYAYGGVPRGRITAGGYYYKLRKFKKLGLVKKIIKNNKIAYELTEKARHLRRQPSVKIDRNDGLSTIVMFDIPESKHNARDSFRRFLLRNGYVQIQKSVFICPFVLSRNIKELIAELGIEKNVTLVSGKIDREV
jgi:DNA-binding transcriptional regulator PaaX